jgi:lipid II isoglutaminyl synthase (glutamine-hydrolysing)
MDAVLKARFDVTSGEIEEDDADAGPATETLGGRSGSRPPAPARPSFSCCRERADNRDTGSGQVRGLDSRRERSPPGPVVVVTTSPTAGVHGSPGSRPALATCAARAAATLARRARGGSGTVIGGRVLLAVAPEAVSRLSHGRRIVLITGTNGKSTTTALTVAALDDGRPLAANTDGANTSVGVAGRLATTDADRIVLEVDEGWLPWTIRETSPEAVVLTNLSRDQLSRHHEVASLEASWRRAAAVVPVVVANADDPAVVWPALAARRQVWVAVGVHWTADSVVCPACGGRCTRSAGDWSCSSCSLRRPHPDWWLEDDVLCSATSRTRLPLRLPGRFNIANAAQAVVAAHVVDGVPLQVAAARLSHVTSVGGRFEEVRFRGHDLRVMLAKNPAGWLELLDLMKPDRHPLVLMFNAEGVDGRDPSWLYDVSFAPLRGRTVVVQGRRATDLLVRLEHDAVAARAVEGSLADALWQLPTGRVDVVGNYTAFRRAVQEVRRG